MRCTPATCSPNDPCASCQDRILALDLTAAVLDATNRKENPVNATMPAVPPVTVEVSTTALRSWANELLSVLDKAEQPFTQRLAADETLRTDVLYHLCKVRAYRDEVIEAVADNLTWSDFSEAFAEDAADDTDLRDALLDNLDWEEVSDQFSRELKEVADDAIKNASIEEILQVHDADDFAEDPDVRKAVLASLTEKERESVLPNPELGQRVAAALAAVGRVQDDLRSVRNTVLDSFNNFEAAYGEIRAIAPTV